MEITDKEFAVINEISNNNKPTQRHIAKKVNISLGLTNLIIKHLIKKGYIKIKEVPPRTLQYILTPKGFAEKAKKSCLFTLRTINSIKAIKENIEDIIAKEYKYGARNFIISGNRELILLLEIAIRDLKLTNVSYSCIEDKIGLDKPTCDLLTINSDKQEKRIDILEELSKKDLYY